MYLLFCYSEQTEMKKCNLFSRNSLHKMVIMALDSTNVSVPDYILGSVLEVYQS